MRALALAITLFVAVPAASADFFDAMGLGVYAAKAGESLSTELALQRDGVVEGNPFLANRSVRLSVGVVTAPLFNLATAKIHKTRPRLALWMRIGVVVGWGYVTAHNLRVGR